MRQRDARIQERYIRRILLSLSHILSPAKDILNPLGLIFRFESIDEIDWHTGWGNCSYRARSNSRCGHLIRRSFDQNNRVFRKFQAVGIDRHPFLDSRGHKIVDLSGFKPNLPCDWFGRLWKGLSRVSPQIPQSNLSKHADTVRKISIVGVPNTLFVWRSKVTSELVQLVF